MVGWGRERVRCDEWVMIDMFESGLFGYTPGCMAYRILLEMKSFGNIDP